MLYTYSSNINNNYIIGDRMNKIEFVEKLSKELKISKIETSKTLDTVLKCIMQSLKTNDHLRFVGFGTFKVKKVKASEVTTPKGDTVKVPAHKRVSLSVGDVFKKVVNNKQLQIVNSQQYKSDTLIIMFMWNTDIQPVNDKLYNGRIKGMG